MPELHLLSILLVLTRVTAFIAFFPLFGRRQIPVMVKAGLALALTFFWYDQVPDIDLQPHDLNIVSAILLLGREFGIGFILALTLGFVFIPARIAGAYVGQEIGLSLASIADPDSTDNSTAVTLVFESLAVILFFTLQLHHFAIIFLHCSMTHLAHQIDLFALPTEDLARLIDRLPEYGLLIVAPVGICMFLVTISLALLNKAAPTLNLFSIGLPLRSGLGLAALLIFMPAIIQALTIFVQHYEYDMEQFLGFFQ